MRKFFTLLLLSLAISNVGFCGEIFIHRSLINMYLWTKFPIKRTLINNQITLDNPNIYLQENGHSAIIKFDFKISNSQKDIEGNIEARSTVFYATEHKLVILKQPTIQKIELKDGKQPAKSIYTSLNLITGSLFHNFPIYKLDEKTQIFGEKIHDIKIKDNGIEISY